MEKKIEKYIVIDNLRVVSASFGTTKYDDEEKYRLSLNGEIPYEDIHAYDDTSAKLTPSWYKDADGYINLNSKFDFAVRRGNKDIMFSEWIENQQRSGYGCPGSIVKVKIKQGDGCVYPVAVVVITDGEPFDPFKDM